MAFTKLSPSRIAALNIKGLTSDVPMECHDVCKLIAHTELNALLFSALQYRPLMKSGVQFHKEIVEHILGLAFKIIHSPGLYVDQAVMSYSKLFYESAVELSSRKINFAEFYEIMKKLSVMYIEQLGAMEVQYLEMCGCIYRGAVDVAALQVDQFIRAAIDRAHENKAAISAISGEIVVFKAQVIQWLADC